MTLDEAVKVLKKWDKQHHNVEFNRFDVLAYKHYYCTSLVGSNRYFHGNTFNEAILSAARWAKKRMEGNKC